ncbi:protein kinase [Myxococcaceae bacterium JPH2]|nr:protein kinase [Myxococcaceae bacterium JPH2]
MPPARPAGAPLPVLPAATLIAERFSLTDFIGHGGMGSIYRAADLRSGRTVALKLLHEDSAEALHRFHREATLLSELEHPGIVGYVAHGTGAESPPFLAMQWLEGEDLARRLARRRLSPTEALEVLTHAARALARAHAHGVIHRDLKPSNLFLRNGRTEEVVLLDFGLARRVRPSVAMTAHQMVLGTPGYMAPEQISGHEALTPAADIFSLGCVLYECLTGRPPFAAPHFVAALAKVLFTQPEPVRARCPELPRGLEALLERMLAKQPAHRIPDASALVTLLESTSLLASEAEPLAGSPESVPRVLLGAEQQLVSVLLAMPRPSVASPRETWQSLRDTLRQVLSPHGAQVELLADGALVVTLAATHGSAMDPAALVARCALLLQERCPEAAVVLTTGRGRLDAPLPVGEAVDRAGQLMHQWEQFPTEPSARVLLDEVTAGLLGPDFQLTRPREDLFLLRGAQVDADESRPLLGKPTPCVGREQELALLELTFNTCVQESSAQAVLVKAPAGLGKSRLRHEFLRRLRRQEQPVLELLGRGDPMSAGSADGLIGQALRRLCGMTGAEPLGPRRERLAERIGRHLPAAHQAEVTGFLGELCGVPFPESHHPRLSAARGNPQLLSTQVGRALVTFLRAECAQQPVLLVLEDLHWGEAHTVRLLDETLRELAEQPFMVLALARPDVEHLLPTSGARRMQELPLRGLSRKAEARLAREVLGAEVPEAVIERLVEHAAGNPLFLEELIRGEAEGRGEAAPRTVLAMIQARLGRLEPRARQVLLAASFYGRAFWGNGVLALLGEAMPPAELEHWLRRLVDLEWVEPQDSSRFPEQVEYRFRHALVRDAAHGLVPDDDKAAGHDLAGRWLERTGERDPHVLAEHFRLGAKPERAIPYFLLAAEHLFDRHDLGGMERCMDATLALSPPEEARVRLRALRATTAFWMDDFSTLGELGHAVLPSLEPGSAQWSRLISGLSLGSTLSGHRDFVVELCAQLRAARPGAESRGAYFLALCFACCMASYLGDMPEVTACFAHLEGLGQEVIARDGVVRGWRGIAHGFRDLCLTGSPWTALDWAEQAARALQEVGSERDEVAALTWRAQALMALGRTEEALEQVRRGMALALRVGQLFPITHARQTLALLLAGSPEVAHQDEARALVLEWVDARLPNLVHRGTAHLVLSRVATSQGRLTEALEHARLACDVLALFAPFLAQARWNLSALLLAWGHCDEARRTASLALEALARSGGEGVARVGLLQVLAESCLALGDTSAGEAALRQALRCIHARAREIPDGPLRERYLAHVPENARVRELTRQRWGDTHPT